MANTERSGALGTGYAIGYQSAYGSHIAANAEMIPLFFPASSITLDEDANIVDNDLISAFGADVADEIGQLWGSGDIVSGVLPNHFIHPIRGILNPSLVDGVPLTVADAHQALPSDSSNPDGTITLADDRKRPQAAHDTTLDNPYYEWPSKLQLVITGGTAATDARMVVKGKRRLGRKTFDSVGFTEVVSLGDDGGTSQVFWNEVDTVDISGITGGTAHQLNWIPDTHYLEAVFRPSDVRFPGYTMILLKGGVPYLVLDAIPINIGISADGTGIGLTMSFLASRVEELRTVAGGLFEEKVALEAADVEYFKNVDLHRMPGWAGAFAFGDANVEENIVKYNSLELNVNRNLGPSEGVDGSKFRTGVSPTDNRQVTFIPNTQFISGELATDTFKRWQNAFRLQQREALSFQMRSYESDSRQNRIDITTPNGQINESPRTEVTSPGPIERRIPFKALTTPDVTSEIKFAIWSKDKYTA